MTNITKWNAPTAYAPAGFTATDFNSLAAGSCVVAATAVTNGASLDLYADVSFSFVVGGTTTSTSYLSLYALPLNQDGTTYGDGTTTGATPPVAGYLIGTINVKSGVTSGTAVTGTFPACVIRPRSFKFVIANNLGVALNAAAAAAVQYSPFDENLNG